MYGVQGLESKQKNVGRMLTFYWRSAVAEWPASGLRGGRKQQPMHDQGLETAAKDGGSHHDSSDSLLKHKKVSCPLSRAATSTQYAAIYQKVLRHRREALPLVARLWNKWFVSAVFCKESPLERHKAHLLAPTASSSTLGYIVAVLGGWQRRRRGIIH
jgi:hypothetical protein